VADRRLPDGDGFDLALELTRGPDGRPLIVALTADADARYAGRRNRRWLQRAGAAESGAWVDRRIDGLTLPSGHQATTAIIVEPPAPTGPADSKSVGGS